MSIILFSLLIIPFCFINNIYHVNGVNTNNFLECLNTSVNKLTKEINGLLDYTIEHKQITKAYNNILESFDIIVNKITNKLDKEKKYTEQRNILFERFKTDMNKIKKEFNQERNQINIDMDKINKQLEDTEESYNKINITIISLISFLVGVGITLTINKFEKSQI